jgi:hypothetical protein
VAFVFVVVTGEVEGSESKAIGRKGTSFTVLHKKLFGMEVARE